MATHPDDEVARQIVDAEYEVVLAHELGHRGRAVTRQVPVGVTDKNIRCKSSGTLLPLHKTSIANSLPE